MRVSQHYIIPRSDSDWGSNFCIRIPLFSTFGLMGGWEVWTKWITTSLTSKKNEAWAYCWAWRGCKFGFSLRVSFNDFLRFRRPKIIQRPIFWTHPHITLPKMLLILEAGVGQVMRSRAPKKQDRVSIFIMNSLVRFVSPSQDLIPDSFSKICM